MICILITLKEKFCSTETYNLGKSDAGTFHPIPILYSYGLFSHMALIIHEMQEKTKQHNTTHPKQLKKLAASGGTGTHDHPSF